MSLVVRSFTGYVRYSDDPLVIIGQIADGRLLCVEPSGDLGLYDPEMVVVRNWATDWSISEGFSAAWDRAHRVEKPLDDRL